MPFKKIKKGKGRGKYRSPSGRTFNKSQVRRYYARGGTFDAASCACRRPHGRFTCDAARTARRDPSQTLDLRRGFTRALETRWRKLSGLVVEALLRQDLFGIVQSSARSIAEISSHGGRVPAFQSWFDAALADTVLSMNRTQWIGQYVAGAYMRGWARTAKTIGRTDIQPLRDRADLLVELTITDLQGAIEVVSQQCVRAFADGIMHSTPAREIVRLIRARIDHIGVVRSRATADFMVVRASNEAALDVLQLAGHQVVGVLPETLPSPGRRKPVRDEMLLDDFNEEEHPRGPHGEFESAGGGGGSIGPTNAEKIKNAEIMFGTNSPQHQEAQRRFGNEKPVAKEGHTRAFVGPRHGESEQLAGKEKMGKKTDLALYRGSKNPKEFGTIKSVKQSNSQRGQGGSDRPTSFQEHHEFKLKTEHGETTHPTVKSAMERAEFLRKLHHVKKDEATIPSFFDAARKRKLKRKVPRELFEVLTAEDDDVCPICEDIADSGPYTLAEARGLIPAHPHCRCQFVPVADRRFAPIVREAA